MNTQIVRPNNGNREGKWVALTVTVILTASTFLLPYHQAETEHSEVFAHQVSITDLAQEEVAMVAELKLAHEEIRDLRVDADTWPEVSELEAFWIAPFVQDQSWQRKGSHQWKRFGSGLYLGLRQDEQGAASMLLDSRNAQADIWFSQAVGIVQASALMKQEDRQRQGWLQIVLVPSPSSNSHDH
ncbi:DUF6162 family protein [Vibrio sp. DNB22_12_1]